MGAPDVGEYTRAKVRGLSSTYSASSKVGKIVRTIAIVRARFKISMMNLGYNIRRLAQLERMAAAAPD